jgi:hypothetical protein
MTVYLSNVSWHAIHRQEDSTLIVSVTRFCTLSKSLVSTGIAVAWPPASRISRSTVLIVDCGEFGSGGNGFAAYASLVDFAATITAEDEIVSDDF